MCGAAQGPGDQAVEEVHAILRQIVGMVLNSPDIPALQRYVVLKREIATTASAQLEKFKVPPARRRARLVRHRPAAAFASKSYFAVN